MQQIKTTLETSRSTLVQDAIGVLALAVLMVSALHAPVLF